MTINASDFQRALEYRRLGFANHEIADALGCADQTLYAALRDVPDGAPTGTKRPKRAKPLSGSRKRAAPNGSCGAAPTRTRRAPPPF